MPTGGRLGEDVGAAEPGGQDGYGRSTDDDSVARDGDRVAEPVGAKRVRVVQFGTLMPTRGCFGENVRPADAGGKKRFRWRANHDRVAGDGDRSAEPVQGGTPGASQLRQLSAQRW